MRPITKADIKRAYRETSQDGTLAAAARWLGVHPQKLRMAELRHGLFVHDLADKASDLYRSGLTMAEVAEQLGVTVRTVTRIMPVDVRRPRGRRPQQ